MTCSEILQLGLLLAAITGLIIALIFNFKQLRILNKQQKLNVFIDYTKRYQDIILNFPENINEVNFSFDKLDMDIKEKTLRYMRAYFDLCSEELDMFNDGYIEKRIWENWEGGINFTLSKTAFREAWKIINLDTQFYPDFSKFMQELLNK